jgi:hypothetical protein
VWRGIPFVFFCETPSGEDDQGLSYAWVAVAAKHFEVVVLPGGLGQLPPKKILFTVILTTVSRAEVCNRA